MTHRKILTKARLLGVALLALVASIIAIQGLALAASPAQVSQAKIGLFGTVTAKGSNSFTIQTNQGVTDTLAVMTDTKFRMPGKDNATLNDVSIGSRVAVLASGQAGSRVALQVMVVPGEPQREHRVLTVVDISGKTLIAEDADGNRVEVELDHALSADIKGQIVTFIGEKSQQSDRFKANVEVKINQIVKRLENHAKTVEAEAKAETDAKNKEKKNKELDDLKARLEDNMQRHLDLMSEVIAKAPAQAKASLEAAMDESLRGYKTAIDVLGEGHPDAHARLQLRTIHGTVETINAQAMQLTVNTRIDAAITLKVATDTVIRIGEKAGTFADIAVGDQVTARFDQKTSVASEIRVETEVEAEGAISSVDTAQGQLKVTLSGGATLTLKLTANTKIEVNGKAATAADLKTGASVEVKYDLKTMEAFKVEVSTEAKVKGTIKSVDTAAGTVVVTTDDGKDITVKVGTGTKVDIQGILFGLLGLTTGMKVEVKYDLTTSLALEIKARAEGQNESKGHTEARATGTVAAVNIATGEITVNLDQGGTITVKTSANTKIELNGQQAGLAQLAAGVRVKVEYDIASKVATDIEARTKPEAAAEHEAKGGQGAKGEDAKDKQDNQGTQEAEAHGTIDTVDTANHKLTLKLKDGTKLALAMDAQTVVRVAGNPSGEAGLTMGMNAEVRYRSDTKIVLRINAEATGKDTEQTKERTEIEGKVKSINLVARQLVVETEDGKTVLVAVTTATKITKGGKLITLADISASARINVKLQAGAAGSVATAIVVQAEGR